MRGNEERQIIDMRFLLEDERLNSLKGRIRQGMVSEKKIEKHKKTEGEDVHTQQSGGQLRVDTL